jgi:diguanylate cyclase (GGDEF)-like protein
MAVEVQTREQLEKTTEELPPPTEGPVPPVRRDACLVHIYPTGPSMGRRYPLAQKPLVIGRGIDCDIHIDDHAVSRRHARIQPADGGYQAADLGSTNGTLVNDVAVAVRTLEDGDYLRVGNCIYRFLAGGNVEAEYHEEIYRLTIIDALTGVANKRCLLEFLGHELARAARYRRPLALVLLDIDRFKAVNDEHGHLCGDYVLRELAACLKPVIRADELFARYGGEEFAVVLPECPREPAAAVGERLRALVETHPFRYDGRPLRVTISVGVAATTGHDGLSSDDLIGQADDKLYEAKRAGRNRVLA